MRALGLLLLAAASAVSGCLNEFEEPDVREPHFVREIGLPMCRMLGSSERWGAASSR